MAMFERLSEHWSLRGEERETLLGGISKSTWSEWRQRGGSARIKSDTRERIANLFTIDLNAHALFAPEFADRWVREPNTAFGGESALSRMLRGRVEDVITVRRYLERVRTSSPTDADSPARELTVSYLPAGAVDSNDEDAALPALRGAVANYERLLQREPARYAAQLASALDALATGLEGQDRLEALSMRRRAVELRRQAVAEDESQVVELLGSLMPLYRLLRKLHKSDEAYATGLESAALFERCERLVTHQRT